MFAIPSLDDLAARARGSFRRYLPGSDAWLFPNNINPSAKVIAGAVSEVFGFADYIQRQKFAGTADGENLDLHGQEYGLARRPAIAGEGDVQVVALDSITVETGAILQRSDGLQYIVSAGGALTTAGTLTLDVVARDRGKTGNANAGTPLDFVSGFVDVNGTAQAATTVGTGGIVGGADIERDGDFWTSDLSTFRGRILFRKRNPPHGGAPADYVSWASEITGVTRVYVERRYAGPSTVRIFVLMDDLYSDGIPPAADIARVQDYIDTQAPAGAIPVVAAPAALPVDITISGLLPGTTNVQAAVTAEIRGAFSRLSRPAGIDTDVGSMPFLAYPTSFSRSWLWQAAANASGEERHSISAPAADVALTAGQMATFGSIAFV